MSDDVIVLGLGAIGASTAHQLARMGHRVLGLERFTPAHDQGASHGETRCIFRAYFMGPRYVPLVHAAYEMWAEISEQAGVPLLTRTGTLLLSSGSGGLVARSTATATQCDLEHEMLDAAEVRRRFPGLTPPDDTTALYDPDGGFIRVEPAVRAQLDLAKRAGATLRFNERVHDWRATPDGVEVSTDHGHYRADHLVLCVGSWIGQFLPAMPVRVIRKAQIWLAPEPETDFGTDRFPFWAWDGGEGIAMGFPVVTVGQGAKVSLHTGGDPCEPDQADREVRAGDVEDVRRFMRPRVPALGAGRYVRGEIGLYDMSPDRHFIVGQVPGEERVYLAAGTSGHAFKFSPVLGRALAEMVTNGKSAIDIEVFDPARLGAVGTS